MDACCSMWWVQSLRAPSLKPTVFCDFPQKNGWMEDNYCMFFFKKAFEPGRRERLVSGKVEITSFFWLQNPSTLWVRLECSQVFIDESWQWVVKIGLVYDSLVYEKTKSTCLLYGVALGQMLGVSKNSVTPKSSILIGFFIIFTIHFGGFPPIFGNTR